MAYDIPGIYVEEVATGPRPIEAVGTSTAGFVGVAPDKNAMLKPPEVWRAVSVSNWSDFRRKFADGDKKSTPLSLAVFGFFENGGQRCYVVNLGDKKSVAEGLVHLEAIDEIAIVAAPGFTDQASYGALITHCEQEGRRDRVAILDAPARVAEANLLYGPPDGTPGPDAPATAKVGAPASQSGYATFYFPWLRVRDPLDPMNKELVEAPPSGHIAGIWARTDARRGVHKAPANEPVRGALGLTQQVTRAEQGGLNSAGVNCIRYFPLEGILVWGARTVTLDKQWKYLSVRRLFNMIEESIAEGTRWVVFEPNDATLWKAIRRDVSAFLTRLWRSGALMGSTPEEAFFVKCDAETNPSDQIDAGIVTTVIGIAPVKPAEFIVFKIGQSQAQTTVES